VREASFDLLAQHVREGAIADLGAEVGADDDQQEAVGLDPRRAELDVWGRFDALV